MAKFINYAQFWRRGKGGAGLLLLAELFREAGLNREIATSSTVEFVSLDSAVRSFCWSCAPVLYSSFMRQVTILLLPELQWEALTGAYYRCSFGIPP